MGLVTPKWTMAQYVPCKIEHSIAGRLQKIKVPNEASGITQVIPAPFMWTCSWRILQNQNDQSPTGLASPLNQNHIIYCAEAGSMQNF